MGELLKWCVRPNINGQDYSGPTEDSLLCAELTLRDYIESMRNFGCWQGIKYCLDEKHAAKIETVLNHKAHHPEYLVCRDNNFLESFDRYIQHPTMKASEKEEQLRNMLKQANNTKKAFINDNIVRLGEGKMKTEVLDKMKTKDEIFIFGGASLSIMKDVLETCKNNKGLASNITFIGQGVSTTRASFLT